MRQNDARYPSPLFPPEKPLSRRVLHILLYALVMERSRQEKKLAKQYRVSPRKRASD